LRGQLGFRPLCVRGLVGSCLGVRVGSCFGQGTRVRLGPKCRQSKGGFCVLGAVGYRSRLRASAESIGSLLGSLLGSLGRVSIGFEHVQISLSPFSSLASRTGLVSQFRLARWGRILLRLACSCCIRALVGSSGWLGFRWIGRSLVLRSR
jgi:hypothetical protein